MSKNVLLYDDEIDLAKSYVDDIKKLKTVRKFFKVKHMESDEFKREMGVLRERQRKLRHPTRRRLDDVSFDLDLDNASIFIIDFDLVEQSDSNSFLTGEHVAYLARCFSKCGLILGYRAGGNTFDLTLKGNLESYADLDIRSKDLGNPGLWGEKREKFRPWNWPHLLDFLGSFEKRVDDVIRNNNLKKPICHLLGIPEEVVRTFPKSVSEFIGGDPAKTTFREFVENSGNGLQEKDKKAADEMVGRIGAARISKWLEQLVLPGQDILVDAPHLVYRYPSLLKGNPLNVNTWNKTAKFASFKNLGLDYSKIEKFRFKKYYWLSRPAWFWKGVSEYQKIVEVSEPWKKKTTVFAFCEDISSFYKRENCKEFDAELESPYVRRFVRYFPRVKYRPIERLTL